MDYWLVQVCVTCIVLNRVKAFINGFVGDNGGGALVASFSLTMHRVLLHGVFKGVNPVHYGHRGSLLGDTTS